MSELATTALRLSPDGRIDCLYTEAIDLRALGRLEVVRATEIAFEPAAQQWEVRSFASGRLLFSDPSREVCLQWERENLQPSANVTTTAEAPGKAGRR